MIISITIKLVKSSTFSVKKAGVWLLDPLGLDFSVEKTLFATVVLKLKNTKNKPAPKSLKFLTLSIFPRLNFFFQTIYWNFRGAFKLEYSRLINQLII
tara:strand:- start:230 stop:523 length:294 start_codon:yes stop_codon:yes gene_type:complete